MESLRALLRHHIKAAWRRRWYGVAIAWIICGIGWAGVYALPNQYESSARMFVDADAILTPLLKGLAADNSAVTQLDVLQRTLLSNPNLEKLIAKTDLDLDVNGPRDREAMVKAPKDSGSSDSPSPMKTHTLLSSLGLSPRSSR